MKICSVSFLNINSLQGTHSIDFEAFPLSESGLFLLSGPTGAGKTSILDAITVALYGTIPRYSINRNNDICEIMSRGTGECWAAVDFESNGKRYRSKWSTYRSRKKANGAFQSKVMELCELPSGTILESIPKKVVAEVERITGLSCDQFLRSMMLAQGDFSAFLKAKENERADLLDKMVGTSQYSAISMEAFKKASEEKQKLAELSAKIDESRLISDEEKAFILAAQDERTILIKNIHTELDLLRAAKLWRTNCANFTLDVEAARVAAEKVHAQQSAAAEDFARLATHRRALPAMNALSACESLEARANDMEKEIERLLVELPAVTEEVQRRNSDILTAKNALAAAQGTLESITPSIDATIEFDKLISHLLEKLPTLEKEKTVAENNLKNSQEEQRRTSQELEKVQITSNELHQWLQSHERDAELEGAIGVLTGALQEFDAAVKHETLKKLDVEKNTLHLAEMQASLTAARALAQEKQILAGKLGEQMTDKDRELTAVLTTYTLESLAESLALYHERHAHHGRLLDLATQFQAKIERRAVLREEFRLGQERRILLTQEITDHTAKIEAGTTHLDALRTILDLQKRIQNYEQARGELVAGEACPLCGSAHHPFVDHYESKTSTAEQDVKAQETLLKNLEQKRREFESESASLSAAQLAREDEGKRISADVQTLENSFAATAKLAEVTLTIDAIDALRELMQVYENNGKALAEQKTKADALKKQWELLRESHQQAEKAFEMSQNDAEKLALKTADLAANAERLAAEYTAALTERERRKTLLDSMIEQFSIANQANPLAELTERAAEWKKRSAALQESMTQIATLTEKSNALTAQLAERSHALEEIRLKIAQESREIERVKHERTELFGEKNPLDERKVLTENIRKAGEQTEKAETAYRNAGERLAAVQSTRSTRDSDIKKIHNDAKIAAADLQQSLQTAGFTTPDELRMALLSSEEFATLEEREKTLLEAVRDAERQLIEKQQQLTQEQDKALTEQTIEEITEEIRLREVRTSDVLQEIGKFDEILRKDKELRTEFADITKAIEVQKQEYMRWEKLNDLIGSAKGDKFQRFAQGLTLVRLVRLANIHLRQLNDRYILEKIQSENLALQIIDTYQADERRAVESLSGGETFLISLALALGLSDLASNRTQIDSLFIDEGFGTLDNETLDTVMSALENLQATGKSVGVISHVEMMKERIATQIQVIKKGEGMSSICIVPGVRN